MFELDTMQLERAYGVYSDWDMSGGIPVEVTLVCNGVEKVQELYAMQLTVEQFRETVDSCCREG